MRSVVHLIYAVLLSQYDFAIHPTYTYFAMERLVEEGLARSIGVSNFNSEQITDIMDRCMIKPAVNQVGFAARFG